MQARFSEWLRVRLKELDWSNADLERASGVDGSNISRWLDAERPRRPTSDKLKKIAGPLGVPYLDLMKIAGYLPGEPTVRDDIDNRLAAMTLISSRVPRPFWQSFIAATTAIADAFSAIEPVSAAGTDPISAASEPSNGVDTAPGHGLTTVYPVRLALAVERVMGFMPDVMRVSA